VLDMILDRIAPEWVAGEAPMSSPDEWRQVGLRALQTANQAILDEARETGLPGGQTTLSIALVRPDQNLLLCASMGDSLIFRVGADVTESLGCAVGDASPDGVKRAYFLGYSEIGESRLEGMCRVQSLSLGATHAVVLATDGLSEPGIGLAEPAAAVEESVRHAAELALDRRALEASKSVAEAALEAHRIHRAGDNIAAALLWTATGAASD
jgi:serine/threonine protein phosphatase PrpC